MRLPTIGAGNRTVEGSGPAPSPGLIPSIARLLRRLRRWLRPRVWLVVAMPESFVLFEFSVKTEAGGYTWDPGGVYLAIPEEGIRVTITRDRIVVDG